MGLSPVLIWFLIGVAAVIIELLSYSFVIIFFGVGAWAAALAAALFPGLEIELVVFIVVSLSSLFLLRSKLMATFQGRKRTAKEELIQAFPHAGRRAEVIREIPANKEGEIAMGGSYWRATADTTIAVGTEVKVIAPVDDDELLLHVELL